MPPTWRYIAKIVKTMIYIVNYDIKNAERKDAFLNEAKKMGDTSPYLPHAFFIDCPDANQNQNTIYSQLKQSITDEDLFIVVRAPLASMSGWLTSSVVDWLKVHNK